MQRLACSLNIFRHNNARFSNKYPSIVHGVFVQSARVHSAKQHCVYQHNKWWTAQQYRWTMLNKYMRSNLRLTSFTSLFRVSTRSIFFIKYRSSSSLPPEIRVNLKVRCTYMLWMWKCSIYVINALFQRMNEWMKKQISTLKHSTFKFRKTYFLWTFQHNNLVHIFRHFHASYVVVAVCLEPRSDRV